MKRILISGGAGFIGSHLCERLLKEGNDVICIDNYFTGHKSNIRHLLKHPNFEVIRHDIVYPYMAEVEEIYNLACPASPIYYQHDPIKTTQTSVIGAMNMLAIANRNHAKILQASTSEVYGDPLIHPQPEDYWGHVNPLGLRSCYDEGKRCAESLFMSYYREHGVPVKIVRIFNTYGPKMDINDGRVVSNFIVQALRGEQYHHLRRRRADPFSFQYIDDLIEGMLRMMTDNARRLHGAGQYRQPERIHDLRAGAHRPRTHRLQIENHPHAPAVGRPAAAQTRHHPRPQDARRLGTDDPTARRTAEDDRLLRRGLVAGRNPALTTVRRSRPAVPAFPPIEPLPPAFRSCRSLDPAAPAGPSWFRRSSSPADSPFRPFPPVLPPLPANRYSLR